MSVNLRPIVFDDIDYLNKWKNDRQIYQYLGGGFAPVSLDQQRNWMSNIIDLSGNNRRFIIEVDNHPIGMVGLYDIHWVNQSCDLGLFIGEKDYQGRGLASEGYRLIEDYAKNDLNLRKIKLKLVETNEAALRLWTSVEFKVVGKYEKDRYIQGKYFNVLIMEKFL